MTLHLAGDELETVREILAAFVPQLEVRAFGSRVHGRGLKEFSDLDLVVMSQEPIDPALMDRLSEAFSDSDLRMRVDVADWAAIDASLRDIINREFEIVRGEKGEKGSGVFSAERPDRFDNPPWPLLILSLGPTLGRCPNVSGGCRDTFWRARLGGGMEAS